MMANIDRSIGKLEGAVEKLEGLVETLVEEMKELRSQRDRALGGYKVLMIVGAGVSSVFGVVGALIVDWITKYPVVDAARQVAGL